MGTGIFDDPVGACMGSDGLIYVADAGNHRIQVFRHDDGSYVGKWGSKGKEVGQFKLPYGVCCSENGVLYVADLHRIQAFSLLHLQI